MEDGSGGINISQIILISLVGIVEGLFFLLIKILLDKNKDLSKDIDDIRKTQQEHGEDIGYLKGRINGK